MKAIGIILAGGNSKRMKELTRKRATPALNVGGSFRCIDFPLSCMANSHIGTVAVITQYNSRTLIEHLSSAKWWDFGRKNGGLFLFTPTVTPENSDWYKGTADSMYQNLDFIKRRHEEFVVIANGDCVYKLNYNDVIRAHVDKKADITVVCKEMPETMDVTRYGVVEMDAEGRITEFEEKPLMAKSHTISAGIYVIRRSLLIELLERNAEEGRYDFVGDILFRYRNVKRVMGYMLETYWSNIADVGDYFRTNMDFLKPEVRNFFFRQEPKISSKVQDLAPAKFNPGSNVKNSTAAAGCIINGTVENSVLCKQVFIGKNSVVKNAVILSESYIGENVRLENCIVESYSNIKANSVYQGGGRIQIISDDSRK